MYILRQLQKGCATAVKNPEKGFADSSIIIKDFSYSYLLPCA